MVLQNAVQIVHCNIVGKHITIHIIHIILSALKFHINVECRNERFSTESYYRFTIKSRKNIQ